MIAGTTYRMRFINITPVDSSLTYSIVDATRKPRCLDAQLRKMVETCLRNRRLLKFRDGAISNDQPPKGTDMALAYSEAN